MAVSTPVDCEPLTGLAPAQPLEAEHEVAFVADHVRVELVPLVTVLGPALSVTTGAGVVTAIVVDFVALPPAPVQVNP